MRDQGLNSTLVGHNKHVAILQQKCVQFISINIEMFRVIMAASADNVKTLG